RACHTMQQAWDRWSTSEHRNITCKSCHETGILEGTEQLILFSLEQPERVSKHSLVSDQKCKSCHESGNPKWRQVADTVGHKVHVDKEGIACVKCHSVTLHRFQPPKLICGACHENNKMKMPPMAEVHCSTCHQFLSRADTLLPGREPCLSCHQAQKQTKVDWPKGAPMQFSCRTCHQPHEQEKPIVDCLSCHKDASAKGLHPQVVQQGISCQTCHKPHSWKLQ
ncbi:MAG: hypothetical protein Q8O76_10445, partial [Chloroflexota bacterium]|nr:hypothetical protein [Chloroflexota bacterium]